MSDKRIHPRQRKRLTLRFGLDETKQLSFTEDISHKGLFIKTSSIALPGSLIKIVLTLPDNIPVTMEARVMWAKRAPANMIHLVKKCGMGVRIIGFHGGEEAFRQYCGELPVP